MTEFGGESAFATGRVAGAQASSGGLDKPLDTSTRSDKRLLAYDLAHDKYIFKEPVGWFNVRDYATTPGGAVDTGAVQRAMNAILATPNGSGKLYFPYGTYDFTTGGRVISPPANMSGRITVVGDGRAATFIKLHDACAAFIQFLGPFADNTYGNISVEDLSVNSNSSAGTNIGAFIDLPGFKCNVTSIEVRRCNLTNGGGFAKGRRGIAITSEYDTWNTTTQYSIKNITIEDLNFQGTNGLLLVQGYSTNRGGASGLTTDGGTANVLIDNIVARRCTHDTQDTPTSVQPSSGFMVGGDGFADRVTVDDCHSYNCGDTAFEFDTVYRLKSKDCTATDPWSACVYIACLGGTDPLGRGPGTHVYENFGCISTYHMGISYGFNANSVWNQGLPHLTLLNCWSRCTIPDDHPSTSPCAILAGVPSLTIENWHSYHFGLSYVFTSNNNTKTSTPVQIQLTGGRSKLKIDGLHYVFSGTYDQGAHTGNAVKLQALSLAGNDMTHDIRNVTVDASGLKLLNGVTAAIRVASMGGSSTSPSGTVDGFSVGFTIHRDFLCDTGNDTDVTANSPTAANLNSTANHGVEKRFAYLRSSQDTYGGAVDRQTDSFSDVGAKPGAVLTAGYKVGVFVKEIDAANFIEGYVLYDGTQSLLYLDKVVAGVRTSLLGAIGGSIVATAGGAVGGANATGYSDRGQTLTTPIAASTTFFVRTKAVGDTITVGRFTALPANPTTVGDTAVSVTLTGADKKLFGSHALGYIGFSWVPATVDAKLTQFRNIRGHVHRGEIRRLRVVPPPPSAPGAAGVTANLLAFDVGYTPPVYRLVGRSKIADCDAVDLLNAGTVAEFNWADTTLRAQTQFENIAWVTPPAPSAPAPGASPWTYTVTSGNREHVSVTGGTVSSITITRLGGTASASVGTSWSGMLEAGDAVTVTYTVAPTVVVAPLL